MTAPHPTNRTPRAAVVQRVDDLLNDAPITSEYRAALMVALACPDNILSASPDARWARLVWSCCRAAGGTWERAIPVAAAVEAFMVGLDVLDDEEDQEESLLRIELGPARTLNVSTGLLFLAHWGLLNIDYGPAAHSILLGAGLRACSGQHADLAPEEARPISLEEALAVTAAKSASLVAAICQLGALSAGADEITQAMYACFGWNLGMVKQLGNDLTALHPNAVGKTDLALGRPTLPLTYVAFHTPPPDSDHNEVEHRGGVWTSGATQLTWSVAEAYRRRALGCIEQLTTDSDARQDLAALVPRFA